MDTITRFLLDFFLVRNFSKFVRNRAQQLQTWLSNLKPFSWEVSLMLSLLSWFVVLILQEIYLKKFVSIFAWGFLIIGVDWALFGRTITIPLVGFRLRYAPWIAGAIACIALLTNDFIITDWRGALVSWPIVSAAFAGYSRFIASGFKWRLPDSTGRQDLVLLFLFAGLLSCWFQFHFMIQDILRLYPYLLTNDFDRSLFVVRLNPDRKPTSPAYPLLEVAEQVVREELTGKTWEEASTWLNSLNESDTQAELSRQIVTQLYGDRLPREQQLWQITTETSQAATNSSSIDLTLRALWQGASSRPDGYAVKRSCTVQRSALSTPQTFADLQAQTQFGAQLTCQPAQEEQA
ncbi:DUF5357 family protein [Leptolyngbya sp. NK1-12]|uniref:DUF5357 family protein n=1 Tax=Leptolyngbya sp. NK1-12 TaxID=2547451 RepID=A0AA97ALX9_9CYAN|nr:DUF5357 family protein [Leptolyngbya sp. NK1-12]